MNSIQCHICGHVNEISEEQSAFCVQCGADLVDTKAEIKLMEASLYSYAIANKNIPGYATAYLTDKRLIVIPHKLEGFGLTGVITATIINKMTNKSGIISVPLNHVKSIKDGRFGLLLKAIIVDTIDGNPVKIAVPKRKEWKEVLIKSIKNT